MPILIRGCFILLLFAPCGFARDETHTDPSGFTLTYPDHWFPITNSELKDIVRAHPKLSKFIGKNNLDLIRTDFVLFRETDSEVPASINVVASPRQWIINDAAVADIKNQLTAQYRKKGVEQNGLQCRIGKVGSRDAIVVDYMVTMSEILPQTIRQRQLYIPGGGKTYCITISADIDDFGKLESEFEQVLSGFQAPEPIPTAATPQVSANEALNKALTCGIIGAVVGIIIGSFKKFMGRKESPNLA